MIKRTFLITPVVLLAFGGLAVTGVGSGAGSGVARALPCSNDMTDPDYCGRTGGSSGGGGGVFGTGPGQVNLLPGVTNGPINLTPGVGSNPAPAAGSGSDTPGTWERHLAIDCPQPFSQTCTPRQGVNVYSTGPVFALFTADGPPAACAPGNARIFIDGRQKANAVVQPGQDDGGHHFNVSKGEHLVEVQMDGVPGGCNTGSMSGWSGTLHVETQ